VRVLCTSQEPLAVDGEVTFPVPVLETAEDAVRLFIDRARAADPGFVMSDVDLGVVKQICAQLDRLPLAIELAAPGIRLFSPEELLARLTNRLKVLAAARRDLPARQRTMRATVEWSYHLLTEPQRVLFGRLAVFTGSFGLAAVEDACGVEPLGPDRVTTLLAELHERSMLVVERPRTGASRYRLLETVRDFAGERLAETVEAPQLRRRHFVHYLAAAERVDVRRLRAGVDAEVKPETSYTGRIDLGPLQAGAYRASLRLNNMYHSTPEVVPEHGTVDFVFRVLEDGVQPEFAHWS
jgi:predicted ATPase